MASTTGGLLRLPAFLRSVMDTVRDTRVGQDISPPVLFNDQGSINDIFAALGLAVFLFALRVLLHQKLFPWVFAQYPKALQPKLSENLFYSVCYTLAFAIYLIFVRPSVDSSINMLRNDVDIVRTLLHPIPPPMNVQERLYYIQAGGFYLSAMAFLMIFDGRRSDASELFIHHIVTIGLIGASYVFGYVRLGTIVVALHDIGDVFLYSAKFVHYLGYKGLDTAIFAVFAVTFYVTRLLLFPRITFSIIGDTLRTMVEQPSFNNWALHFDIYLWHWAFFVLFLGTLLVLHCFWFALILKMIYREVFLGEKITDQGDIRSDDEGDDEGDDESGATANGDGGDDFFEDPKSRLKKRQ